MRFIPAILCAFVLVSAARAEIIIDDFTDPASVGGLVDRDATVITSNVGDLGASRTINLNVSNGMAIGAASSNAVVPGHFFGEIADVISNPLPTSGTLVSISLTYRFGIPTQTVDLSEGGQNNALFLDFESIEGLTPPPRIRFWLFDETVPGLSYVRFLSPVPTSTEPFTMVVPFDTLRDRGAGTVGATFENSYLLDILFQANEFFGAPEELGWRIELDRIRVGVIPEPSTFALLVAGLLLFLCPRRLR